MVAVVRRVYNVCVVQFTETFQLSTDLQQCSFKSVANLIQFPLADSAYVTCSEAVSDNCEYTLNPGHLFK